MDYRRVRVAGAACFFTVVTAGRRPVLVEHVDRLRTAFRRVAERRPFRIDAIVVLPDHLHAMWTGTDQARLLGRASGGGHPAVTAGEA